jgi:hypothetical protein
LIKTTSSIANQAADYCTNWLIDTFAQEWRDAHNGKENPIFKLPSGALRSEEHGPRSFEEIYHLLLSKWKKQGKPKLKPSPSGQLMPSPDGKPQGGKSDQGKESQETGKGAQSGATDSNVTPEGERAQLMAERLARAESRLSQILTAKENGDWAGDSISSASMKKTLNYKDICWKSENALCSAKLTMGELTTVHDPPQSPLYWRQCVSPHFEIKVYAGVDYSNRHKWFY